MSYQRVARLRRIVLLMMLAATATPAAAQSGYEGEITLQAWMPFRASGLSPWGEGREFIFSDHKFLGLENLDVAIPTRSIDPYRLLADAVGLPIPQIGFVDASAHMRGKVGFRFEYHLSGGRLDIDYPARLTTRVRGVDTANRTVPSGTWVAIDTVFEPGFARDFVVLKPECSGTRQTMSAECMTTSRFAVVESRRPPRFSTTFPIASARLAFEADLDVAARLRAGAVRFGDDCYLCKEVRVPWRPHHEIELLHLGVDRLSVIGPCEGGHCSFPLSGRRIPLGGGYLTFKYPVIDVTATYLHDNGLRVTGSGGDTILEFSGAIEKLIPAVGPFLSNDAGLVDYMLFETTAGPTLSVRQEFELVVEPRVRMEFSRQVQIRSLRGTTEGRSIDVPVGTPLSWRLPGREAGPVAFRPHYYLKGKFRNETGLGLGYSLRASALRVGAGPAKLGPGLHEHLSQQEDIASIPLIRREPFDLDLRGFDGEEIGIEVLALVGDMHKPPRFNEALSGASRGGASTSTSAGTARRPTHAATMSSTRLPVSSDRFVLDERGTRLYVHADQPAAITLGRCEQRPASCAAFMPGLRLHARPTAIDAIEVRDISTTTINPRTVR